MDEAMSDRTEPCPECNGTGTVPESEYRQDIGNGQEFVHKFEARPCVQCNETGRLGFIEVRIDVLEECYDSVLDLLANVDGDHPYYDRKYASERALRDKLKAMLPQRTALP